MVYMGRPTSYKSISRVTVKPSLPVGRPIYTQLQLATPFLSFPSQPVSASSAPSPPSKCFSFPAPTSFFTGCLCPCSIALAHGLMGPRINNSMQRESIVPPDLIPSQLSKSCVTVRNTSYSPHQQNTLNNIGKSNIRHKSGNNNEHMDPKYPIKHQFHKVKATFPS